MRSSVCKIEKGTGDLSAILAESEKVSEYIGLDRKEAMKLRLICEEIDGLLPNITDEFEGDFWIDHEDGVCKVNVSIRIPEFNAKKKKELISLANDKRNAAATGIIGKIRNAIENFFLSEGSTDALDASSITFHTATGYSEGVDYSYLWSLQQYKDTMEKDETETWDELEKSVITSVADDVIVSIRGNSADIVIVKSFI
jgi:hypothetical protein